VYGWKHGGYLSAAFIYIESLIITAIMTMVIALCMIIAGKRMNNAMEYRIGVSQGLQQNIEKMKLDTVAN
jgi:uncharacterized protein YoxC